MTGLDISSDVAFLQDLKSNFTAGQAVRCEVLGVSHGKVDLRLAGAMVAKEEVEVLAEGKVVTCQV
jgi:hypothetical protein